MAGRLLRLLVPLCTPCFPLPGHGEENMGVHLLPDNHGEEGNSAGPNHKHTSWLLLNRQLPLYYPHDGAVL